jgi:MscS family membrane protein
MTEGDAVRPRVTAAWWTPLLAALVIVGSTTVSVAAESSRNPLEPVDTSSPRATFLAFLDNTEKSYRSWLLRKDAAETDAQARRALRTLDLRYVGEALLFEIGIADALYLYETLNRIDLLPLDSIPDATAVAAQSLTRWSIPGTEITIAKVADGERAGEFLFTSESVARAHQFYDLVRDRPVQRGPDNVIETWRAGPGLAMPDLLAAQIWGLPRWAFSSIWGQPVWKWLAVSLGSLATAGIVWLAWWLGRQLDKRMQRAGIDWRLGQPAAVLCAIAAVTGLQVFVERAVLFREQPAVVATTAITAVRYVLLAWLVAVLIGGIGNAVMRRFASGTGSLDAALIRLCFRILSIIGALLVVLHAASEFGLSITPIIAGLGIGGLAVALAIRPTLENIIGGFVLFLDKPVGVGEFCGFGDKTGTVEEIGLRSTRIRGLDRTVITVPNADFAQLQIVNYTRRDMNLFQSSISLRYETTPDQLRYVAAKIRKLLIQHNKVLLDLARVRLSAFGDSAFVLEVFAFVRGADWDEFLAVKEGLNLRIAEIVRESGTGFAVPSRTVHYRRDTGLDDARAEEAEAEVRRWREEKRLPFPEFDFAERAEMADTLPYPPEGSPDFQPSRPQIPPPRDSGDTQKRRLSWPKLLRRRKEPAAAQEPPT